VLWRQSPIYLQFCRKSGQFEPSQIKEIPEHSDKSCMDLGPIPGIRVTPVAKVRPIDSDLIIPFEIESAARPDDDTYSPAKKKASGAEETDEDSLESEESLEEDSEAEPVTIHLKVSSGAQVNYFA
jgi:hypothetical protein